MYNVPGEFGCVDKMKIMKSCRKKETLIAVVYRKVSLYKTTIGLDIRVRKFMK